MLMTPAIPVLEVRQLQRPGDLVAVWLFVRLTFPDPPRLAQQIPSQVIMEHLPGDVLQVLSSFLSSHDAFSLSHSSSWWLHYVDDGVKWQKRLLNAPTNDFKDLGRRWKKRFMVAPSLQFQGRHTGNNLLLDSFAYLVDTSDTSVNDDRKHFHLAQWSGKSFSFDVWFSLLPVSDGKCAGGIIYGMQSASRESRPWPHYHQPIVVVNPVGDLYCSVLESKPVVASSLETERWYHLALSYDNGLQRQDVYLDGVNVQSGVGALHQEWSFLSHEQVGTGCVTGADEGFPYRGYLGWYGFHGLIDEFRVWSGALSQDDVIDLAHGGRLSIKRLQGSMKRDAHVAALTSPSSARMNVQLVTFTRPSEGKTVCRVNPSTI